MKDIFLRASDLAKLTGHNTYGDPQETLDLILHQNKICVRDVSRSNTESALKRMKPEDFACVKRELGLDTSASIQDVEQAVKKKALSRAYSSNITEDKSRETVQDNLSGCSKEMKSLEESLNQDLRMRRGNIKECKNLDHIQKKRSMPITQRNSQMFTKTLYCEGDQYRVLIRGKVDGISGETIIETKNRTKRLFHTLRDYERVQLEAYMFLTGHEEALLTEHYNEESNEIEYSHDEDFWCECTAKIIDYINENVACHL